MDNGIRYIMEFHPGEKKPWLAINPETRQVLHSNTSRTKLFNVLVKKCVEQAKGMTQAELSFKIIKGGTE